MLSSQEFFEQNLILENRRARLTPLVESDFEDLNKIAYEPSIWKLGLTTLQSTQDLKAYIMDAVTERKNGVSYPFKIFDKAAGQVAGSTRYGNISFPNKRLEIGWTWLHPHYHGSGLNSSCKFLLLQYAFEILGINRVELKTDVLNHQSRKAILKIGAREEGIFRKHSISSTGRVRDSIYFSIIDEDWPTLKHTVFAGI